MRFINFIIGACFLDSYMAEYKDAVLRHQESRSRISEATPNRSAATAIGIMTFLRDFLWHSVRVRHPLRLKITYRSPACRDMPPACFPLAAPDLSVIEEFAL